MTEDFDKELELFLETEKKEKKAEEELLLSLETEEKEKKAEKKYLLSLSVREETSSSLENKTDYQEKFNQLFNEFDSLYLGYKYEYDELVEDNQETNYIGPTISPITYDDIDDMRTEDLECKNLNEINSEDESEDIICHSKIDDSFNNREREIDLMEADPNNKDYDSDDYADNLTAKEYESKTAILEEQMEKGITKMKKILNNKSIDFLLSIIETEEVFKIIVNGEGDKDKKEQYNIFVPLIMNILSKKRISDKYQWRWFDVARSYGFVITK